MLKRILIPLAIALPVLGLLYVGLGMDSEELPSPLVGEQAPPFELEDLHDGYETITHEDFVGDVAVVHVWGSTCPVCHEDFPHLERLSEHGVKVYAFNYRDDRAQALQYLRVRGDPYDRIAHDPEGEAGMEWGVYATPETYVLDEDGTITYKEIGPLDEEVVEEEILSLVD
ncbi:DsbE family thiol:disulfide interchange protein [Halorhodospira halophila]|uniref:DsbE family thiol:disulfide interchange protein n=1 Tax=Halorhodospira halophila TaxID=1053 RepID=UPI0019140E09|nr:DsbE family thiol:disulfide interchange protein [Halorhodospira halophila]MBK5936192.1 thiol:disulfide interchange protein [Halorhodospira halophila]